MRSLGTCTKEANIAVRDGDWVYLDAHSRSLKKLGFKTQGPYMVLQTDGHRFLLENSGGLRTVSSDHLTGAPAPPIRSAKWTRDLTAQALFQVGD